MPRVVVRKGYRSLPGKRRELLAALQRKDALAAEAGWPRGRYLAVETRAPGEPDLEVEFAFESYAELERLERRLRERLARAPREVVSGEQEFLLEPSATRYLLLLDEGAAAGAAAPARRAAAAPPPARAQPGAAPAVVLAPAAAAPPPAAEPAAPPLDLDAKDEDEFEPVEELPTPPPPDYPGLTPAEQQAKQLADARSALAKAEAAVNLAPERRADRRLPGQRPPRAPEAGEAREA